LTLLSPVITEAILSGQQPQQIELKRIPVILKHSLHERNSWRIRSGGVVG
jgi:hypothetical protein